MVSWGQIRVDKPNWSKLEQIIDLISLLVKFSCEIGVNNDQIFGIDE